MRPPPAIEKDFTFDVEIYGKTVSLTWDAKEEHYSGRVDGKDIYLKPKETGSDGGSWVASYDRLEIKGRNLFLHRLECAAGLWLRDR